MTEKINEVSETAGQEIVPCERLGYRLTVGKRGGPVAQFVMTAAEGRDRNVREYRSIEGGEQTLGRWADYLLTRVSTAANGGL